MAAGPAAIHASPHSQCIPPAGPGRPRALTYAEWFKERQKAVDALQDKFPAIDIEGVWLDMVASTFDPGGGATADDGSLLIEGLVEVMAETHELYEAEDFGIPDELVRLAELIDERLARKAA